jgi:Alcohol dehydrogenase GroES-like domain
MKAIVVHEYGGLGVLKLEDAPRPEPKDDQVLIRVIATGVNPVDAHIRTGRSAKFFGTTLPLIPGYDIAGIVEKAGTKISKLKVGDPVYAYVGLDEGGGYAEYAVATEVEAAPKPKSLTFESAAAVPLAALTAWQGLIDAAKLSASQTVLNSRRIGWCRKFCDSNCESARRESDYDGVNRKPGLSEAARGRCGDRLYQAEIRRHSEGCRCCTRRGWQRHARAFLRRG